MDSVAGVNALYVRFVAVSGAVEGRAAEGFGEVGRQTFVVMRVKRVLERMRCGRIFEASLVPPAAEGEDRVEPADGLV